MKKKQLTDTLVLVADPAKDDPMLMGWDKKHELYMTKITFLTFCDSTGGMTPLSLDRLLGSNLFSLLIVVLPTV